MLKFGLRGCMVELDRYLGIMLKSSTVNLNAKQRRDSSSLKVLVHCYMILTQGTKPNNLR